MKGFDGSEYLFACESEGVMGEWVDKIGRVSRVEPREQLMLGLGDDDQVICPCYFSSFIVVIFVCNFR